MITISVKNLRKHFGTTKAVDGISFSVQKGEIVGFLGPNGAGKTTTIRCLLDFIRPDVGNIRILNKKIKENSEKVMKSVGFLSSEINLYERWTGKEHISLVKNIRKVKTYENKLIEILDFDVTKRIKNLSTGNKQKLSLILALMHKPKVLILDEPTTGLDPLLQDVIYDTLQAETKRGVSIFMSSHNLSEVERVCDRVLIIKQGKIVERERISNLKSKRLYTVNVYFEGKYNAKEFMKNGISVTKNYGDGLQLSVKGDIRPLLKLIQKKELRDIEIKHSTLEDVFLEFYK